jgi:hypothetical protein
MCEKTLGRWFHPEKTIQSWAIRDGMKIDDNRASSVSCVYLAEEITLRAPVSAPACKMFKV